MSKRYWLFLFSKKPFGGIADLYDTYDFIDEAKKIQKESEDIYFQIVDSEEMRIVDSNHQETLNVKYPWEK